MSDLLNALARIYQQKALDYELRNLWRRDVPYPARFSAPSTGSKSSVLGSTAETSDRC